MPSKFIIVFLLVLSLCSCHREESFTPLHFLESPALSFEVSACNYAKHASYRFRCYQAEQKVGLKHQYAVTILEPRDQNAANELPTIISIPGGPGQGAQTQEQWVLSWADWLEKFNSGVRFILYEPFGTHGSSAFWRCEAFEGLSLNIAAKAISAEEELALIAPVLEQCLSDYDDYLSRHHGAERGLAEISSQANAQSLAQLINALPASHVHLLGTSYGTRVALLAGGEAKVASIALDSPYPFHAGTLLDWPSLLGGAFALHESQFKTQYPELGTYKKVFDRAFNYLTEKPQFWRLERWDSSGALDFSLTADRLLLLHYHVLYNESMLPLFYKGIIELENKPSELGWVLEDMVTSIFDPTFSSLIYMAVECNDNLDVEKSAFYLQAEKSQDQYTDWQSFWETDVCLLDFFDNSDAVQDQAYVQKPTLIFSGALDPVTPASWAEALSNKLSEAELYVREGKGHGVLFSEPCLLPRLEQLWLEERENSKEKSVAGQSLEKHQPSKILCDE